MNKKAQVTTFLPYILVGIVVVLIFAIVAVPIAEIGDRAFDEFQSSSAVNNTSQSYERVEQVQGLMTTAFDQLIFIILIAVVLGSLAIAIFTDYHPIAIATFIISIVLIVIISALFVNVYDDVKETPEFENKSQEFKFTNVILGKQLPVIIAILGVVGFIIILAKRGRQTAPV